jgi:predicted ATPase
VCDGPCGASDYAALCRAFPALVLRGVPRLAPHHMAAARRLITFVDEAYEHRVALAASLACAPEDVFADLLRERAATRVAGAGPERDTSAERDEPGGVSITTEVAEAAAADEIRFACARAVSRLAEMGSRAYASALGTQLQRARAAG